MSLQQAVNPRSSANGYNRERVVTETGHSMENKLQIGKLNSSRISGTSSCSDSGAEGPLSDRLVYITACLIGHHVDVQVKTGLVYSGIFHTTSAHKDFGIVLKMAQLKKDTSFRGQKAASESFGKSSSKMLIIPAQDLVQIIAKDVSVARDGLANELEAKKQQDLLIDSHISKSHHMDMERELKPWVPDDVPQCPELENIFDSPWTGSWDQFKANEALFGVTSTFDEELYTTKLEKGPQTRDLEVEAMRIAREIEGEEAHDLYIAGEGSDYPHGKYDIDEETMFSSVIRDFDDSGLVDEDVMLDTHNDETFGNSSGPIGGRSFASVTSGKADDGGQILLNSLSMDKAHSSRLNLNQELFLSGSLDLEYCSRSERPLEEERVQENQVAGVGEANPYVKEFVEGQISMEDLHLTKTEGVQANVNTLKDVSDKEGFSPNATSYAPSNVTVRGQEKASSHAEVSEDLLSGKGRVVLPAKHSYGQPGSSVSSTPESGTATSPLTGRCLSPRSSVGSLSSEKSTLNPNAKEFKLNPNAKIYVPSQTPVRPLSPVSDGSYYFPPNVPAVPLMHGMPVGMGTMQVAPPFSGPQPMIFNPPVPPMQSPPHGYFPGNGPQYGQHMIVGHPRQVLYMPGYPTEMQYKGRES